MSQDRRFLFRSNRRLAIFLGVPIAVNVILFALFSDNHGNFHGVSQRALPYVILAVEMGVFLVALETFYRLPHRLAVNLGITGWITAVLVASWYFWFGPGAFKAPAANKVESPQQPNFGWLVSKSDPPENMLVNAARRDDLSEFERIARRPGVSLDRPEQSGLGETPLYAATVSPGTNVFMYLLRSNADVNARNRNGELPIMVGSLNRSTEKLLLLIKAGADINAKDIEGISVLQHAKAAGNSNLVAILLEYGAK